MNWGPNQRYHLVNFRAALDAPGEWFLDRTGRLYYKPLLGEDLTRAEVVAPLVEQFIRFAGQPGRPVEHITLKGLRFHHGQYLLPPEGHADGQAAQSIPAAIMADAARQITLDSCEVGNIGIYEPQTFIPGRLYEPASSSPHVPHIYTVEEIRALLQEALLYPFNHPQCRGLTYYALIAFLYATGLRISEALALTLGDIDWKRSVLKIRKTKFHKARLVPMATSTCGGIKRFLIERAGKGHLTSAEAPLFVNAEGSRLVYSTVLHSFVKIASRAGVRRPADVHPARIHDLRHYAASRTMPTGHRLRLISRRVWASARGIVLLPHRLLRNASNRSSALNRRQPLPR